MSVSVLAFETPDEVAVEIAKALFSRCSSLLETQESVHLALTGGTMGIKMLEKAAELDWQSLDVSRLHFWWGDERYVSADSADRNANQARDAWLNAEYLPKENIHEFPNSDSGLKVAEAAVLFSQTASAAIPNAAGLPNLDILILGVGPDGHVASLFPDHVEGDSDQIIVAVSNSPKPPSERLSFNFASLNNAKELWFVVAGADKSQAVVSGLDSDATFPVGRVSGLIETVWYVDQAALSLKS